MMPQLLAAPLLFGLLVAASIIDLRTRRLPDTITLPLLLLGLAQCIGSWDQLALHAAAALAAFLSLWLVARLYRARTGVDGLGLGDAKLFAAAGAWLGPLYLAPLLLAASLLALTALGVLRLASHPVSMQTRLPFGPFLSAAFFGLWLIEVNHVAIV